MLPIFVIFLIVVLVESQLYAQALISQTCATQSLRQSPVPICRVLDHIQHSSNFLLPSGLWETTEAHPGFKHTLPPALCMSLLTSLWTSGKGKMGSRPLWPLALRVSCLPGSSVALSLSHSSLQVGKWLWERISSDQGARPTSCFSPLPSPPSSLCPSSPPTPKCPWLVLVSCVRATRMKGTPSSLPWGACIPLGGDSCLQL